MAVVNLVNNFLFCWCKMFFSFKKYKCFGLEGFTLNLWCHMKVKCSNSAMESKDTCQFCILFTVVCLWFIYKPYFINFSCYPYKCNCSTCQQGNNIFKLTYSSAFKNISVLNCNQILCLYSIITVLTTFRVLAMHNQNWHKWSSPSLWIQSWGTIIFQSKCMLFIQALWTLIYLMEHCSRQLLLGYHFYSLRYVFSNFLTP